MGGAKLVGELEIIKIDTGERTTIHVDGSSGIAAITWGGAAEMMNVRSRGGWGCADTLPRSKTTAWRET